ncbi:MAG: hypothetical protein PF569_03165 [Candidatus Woesearchaeota archaeon]|jgi:hypothetical protein|nr:hypothetical protein [Candidatus Woesearchaeota archaeon]
MEILKLISYIILALYFLYKLGSSVYIIISYKKLEQQIQEFGLKKKFLLFWTDRAWFTIIIY